MKSNQWLIALVLGLGLALSLLWLLGITSAAGDNLSLATWDVCTVGCPFDAVQLAINAAAPGDLIRVAQGTYIGPIVVTKTVTLQGGYSGPPDWRPDISTYVTVLDGNGTGPVVQVTSGFSPTIDGFTITGGNTISTWDGGGIAVADSSPTLTHNTVVNNRATWGGGIGILRGSPVLSHNIVISNYATKYGGGIYILGSDASPTLSSNQIISNTSFHGGGVFIDDYSSPILINNVIARNRASSYGGGIYIDYFSTPTIVNNTIVANNLGPSWANEGIFMFNTPSPIIVNNIIVTHSSGIRGTPLTITLDYNDVWACTITCYSGVTPGPHDISADPRFVNPESGDYHLQPDSPAIDVGTLDGAPSTDFDGDPRPLGCGVDMGADEYDSPPCHTPTPTPTTTVTPTPTPTFISTPTPSHTPTSAPTSTSLSFFHTVGRDLVSDSTGEKVAFRGVNLNGLEFGSFFDNPYPGVEGTDYFKPRPEDLDSIKALGFNVIRVPFEWARLVTGWQPGDPLPSTLNPTYLGILDEVVQMATERQIFVVLDMHDFLKYWSGWNDQVCVNGSSDYQQLLAHTWELLAVHFRDNPAVLGYDIMNEPVRQEEGEPCGSCNWHAIAQSVVDAIRTQDTNHLILIEGLNYSLASDWPVENGKTCFITDRVTPPRIVYSPHVFFDFNNDSRYDEPGEETGPIGKWEYYVRDRLLPVINWSIDNNVTIFIGETNVPCTADWAAVLDHAFHNFFEPLHFSVTAWHYIDPVHDSGPLNLLACPERYQLDVLQQYPGGPYQETGNFTPTPFGLSGILRGWHIGVPNLFGFIAPHPQRVGDSGALTLRNPKEPPSDSLIYDDMRVNPWDAGLGYWGDVIIDWCATDPVFEGDCSILVHFYRDNFAGLKFVHHYGLDTRRFTTLQFRIYLTGEGQQDFKIFTTSPLSDCVSGPDPVYPPSYDQRPLSDYPPAPSIGQWQRVDIPLHGEKGIVNPAEPIINGIAFQNMGTSQEIFYLDLVTIEPTIPCAVDFDYNGRVEVNDIMRVASRWRCKCGDTCYDPRYDLDGDCDIDIVDIMLVAARWGESCP